jgi:hypothetical protein
LELTLVLPAPATAQPSRSLKPQPRDNMDLFFTYHEYLNMYLASRSTSGIREQAYYMEKTIRAGAEDVTNLHPSLSDEQATAIAAAATLPYGELDEDWESV